MKNICMAHLQPGKLYMFYYRIVERGPYIGMYIKHSICFTGIGEYDCYHVLFGAKYHDLIIGDWDAKEFI